MSGLLTITDVIRNKFEFEMWDGGWRLEDPPPLEPEQGF